MPERRIINKCKYSQTKGQQEYKTQRELYSLENNLGKGYKYQAILIPYRKVHIG